MPTILNFISLIRGTIPGIVIFILLTSCNGKNVKIKSDIDFWLGKELLITDNLIVYPDSIRIQNQSLEFSSYKVVTYIDASCSICLVELYRWEELIPIFSDLDVPALIILESTDTTIFDPLSQDFISVSYPLFHDNQGVFKSVNSLFVNSGFRTFLIDDKNIIKLVGNPVANEELKDLYIKVIREGL